MGAFTTMSASLKDSGVDGKAALGVLERAQQKVSDAFQEYASGDRGPEAYKKLSDAIRAVANNASSAVNAFETFNETVKKAKELIGDQTATLGPYAKHLDNVEEAINKINAAGSEGGPTEDQAKKILAAYGFENGTVAQLENFQKKLKELNIEPIA